MMNRFWLKLVILIILAFVGASHVEAKEKIIFVNVFQTGGVEVVRDDKPWAKKTQILIPLSGSDCPEWLARIIQDIPDECQPILANLVKPNILVFAVNREQLSGFTAFIEARMNTLYPEYTVVRRQCKLGEAGHTHCSS